MFNPLYLTHGDEAVEDLFLVGVAREAVVGAEEACDALFNVAGDDVLHPVDGAATRLAALHIDNGAKGALERASATGVEAFSVQPLQDVGGPGLR